MTTITIDLPEHLAMQLEASRVAGERLSSTITGALEDWLSRRRSTSPSAELPVRPDAVAPPSAPGMAIELDDEANPNTRNFRAFLRDLDDLLEERPGGFVAYSEGQQLNVGDQEADVYRVARGKIPKGLVMVQRIEPLTEIEPVSLRSPSTADRPALPADFHKRHTGSHG